MFLYLKPDMLASILLWIYYKFRKPREAKKQKHAGENSNHRERKQEKLNIMITYSGSPTIRLPSALHHGAIKICGLGRN